MGKKLIQDSTLKGIADAIRSKTGSTGDITPLEMAGTISSIPTGSTGTDTTDATAGAADILSGKTAYAKGVKVTGTALATTTTATAADIVNGKTAYDNKGTLITGSAFGTTTTATASDIASGKTVYNNKGTLITGTHICEAGLDTSDATAAATDIANGKTAYVNGAKVTGNVKTYDSSNSGLSVFGTLSGSTDRITLNYTFDADTLFRAGTFLKNRAYLTEFGDATAADVASGKTFTGADGLKVTGTGSMVQSGTTKGCWLRSNCYGLKFTGLSSAPKMLIAYSSQLGTMIWYYPATGFTNIKMGAPTTTTFTNKTATFSGDTFTAELDTSGAVSFDNKEFVYYMIP